MKPGGKKSTLPKTGFLDDLALHLREKREDCFGPRLTRQRILSALAVYSGAVDDAVAKIAQYAAQGGTDLPCIIATGGYGRGELAPFSDLDLLFLADGKIDAPAKKFIETVQQNLWSLGLKPSCAVHTLKECAESLNADTHFLTSLLERRHVFGDTAAFEKLGALLKTRTAPENAASFIAAKLDERDARHVKTGDTRFILQPNVKEGKGSLRDIQTLHWILAFLSAPAQTFLDGDEAKTLEDAYAFFWTVRCHLHSLSGRADDRLSFDVQPEIATRMGYKNPETNLRAESFMKDYFLMTSEVGHLTGVLCAALEGEALKGTRKMSVAEEAHGFPVHNNRLDAATLDGPADILRLFRAHQQSGLDIHPDTYRRLRALLPSLRAGNDITLLLDILLDPKRCEQTLRRLNESGVLSALVPAFSNISAHMQYDMYHAFTADEHTIRAVGMLHKIEGGETPDAPLAAALFRQVRGRRALYAAMFLHDIAKGTGGLHSERGADIARALCPRLGLAPEETETAAWLVENHLLMTMTAYKRDLNDPKTLDDFTAAVQSPERLRLLAILTTADIMAVGPGKWNSWKSGLLTELCRKAEGMLAGTPPSLRDGQDLFVAAQKKTRRLIGDKVKTFNELADHAPPSFWLEFPPETVASFVGAIHTAQKQTVARVTQKDDHAEVFIHTPDRKGLFAAIAGALAAGGASIADARIFTLGNGMALDVFHVETGNAAYVEKTLKAALAGALDIPAEIAARHKTRPRKSDPFTVAPRVIIDNNASASATVIEVNAKDRTGLLFDITSAISNEGLQISAAKIATFGARAVDVFYVKDGFGLKVMHNEKLKAIEKNLMAAL